MSERAAIRHPIWVLALVSALAGPVLRVAAVGADWPDFLVHVRLVALIVLGLAVVRHVADRRHRLVLAYGTWLAAAAVIVAVHPEGSRPPASLLVFGGSWPGASVAPVVGLLVVAVLIAGRRRPPIDLPRPSIPLVAVIIGAVLVGDSAVDVMARQHVERMVAVRGEVSLLDGPLLPTILWSLVLAVSVGSIVATVGSVLYQRTTRGAWCSPGFAVNAATVTAGAFLVRFATLLTVAPTRTDGGDPLFYHSTANILARGGGFPEPLNFIAHQDWIASALHGPLYPVVLSFSSRFGGSTYFDHKIVSILVGTAVVALTMMVARRVAPPDRRDGVAIVAGVLAAVYPNLWLVDGVLFPEGLMALCTLAVVYFAYRWREKPGVFFAVLMGAATALAALTRGEGLLLSVLVITPWIMLRREIPWKRRFVQLTAAAIACIVVLAPWMLRNLRSFEEFVPLSTNGNELFVYANCDDTYSGSFLGFWQWDCQQRLRDQGIDGVGDEAAKSLFWREVGFDYARENADQLPKVLTARVLRQWDLFRPWQNADLAPVEGRNRNAARAGLVMYYGLVAGSVAGVLSLRRHRRPMLPLVAQFVSVTLTAAYAYGTTRFRVPAEPVLCILAAVGFWPVARWLRPRLRKRLASPASDDVDPAHDAAPVFVDGASVRFSRITRRTAARAIAPWVIIGSWIALALPALYRAVGSTMEEGFMLVFPERAMRGDVANVDFLHLYGPGSLHLLSLWYRVFDVSLVSERTFGLLQHLLVVTGLYVLTRPWGRRLATSVALVSTLFVFTPIGLQALAWSGAVGLGVWSVVFARHAHENSDARWAHVVSGGLAGLTLTFRPDLILALALAHGWMWWRGRRVGVGAWTIGVVVGLTSLFVHLVQAGPAAMWRGMFVEPVIDLRGGRELPRPPSWDHLDGALQVIGEKFAPWWGLPALGTPKQLVLWFFALPFVAIGVVLAARRITPRAATSPLVGARRSETLTAIGLFGVGLLPQALQRPDSAHFNWVSCVSFPLLVVVAADVFRVYAPRWRWRATTASLAVVGTIVLLVPAFTARTYLGYVTDSVRGDLDTLTVERDGREFFLGDYRPWLASVDVVRDLDSWIEPGQKLFVGPVDLRQTAYSDAFFYFLFPELEPATYFIEMDPGLANREGSRLADDVASADWLILTRFWSQWIEPNDSIVFGSDVPNQIVEQQFCLRGSYQVDLARIYERCERGDGIGPYDPPYDGTVDYAVEVRTPVPPRPDGTCTPTCNGQPAPDGEGFNPEAVAAISDAARAVAP